MSWLINENKKKNSNSSPLEVKKVKHQQKKQILRSKKRQQKVETKQAQLSMNQCPWGGTKKWKSETSKTSWEKLMLQLPKMA